MANSKRNIILCGFMGCGKTTVGRYLAKMTQREFIDMDHYIEIRQKMTINKIFSEFGEPEFRRLETETVLELSQKDGLVIAAGGGTLLNAANAQAFQSTGDVVLLDAPLAAIQERLKKDTTRPILKQASSDRNQFIKELHAKRYPLYHSASNFVVNAGAPAKIIAKEIIKALSKREESV